MNPCSQSDAVPKSQDLVPLRALPVALLVLFILIGTFALLGSRGLNEPDEGRYAEMSREMLLGNDWLTPTLHGFARYQKPPVIFWLAAGSFRLFGFNEWAARLPSALAAGAAAWLTFLAGRRLFGNRAGIAAAVVLVTSLEFFSLARTLTPDMVLTFWITAAAAAFVYWMCDREKRRWLWLFFLAMGLGFLTKGPMAVVVPVSAAVAWQIAQRRRGEPVRIPWVRGMLVTLLIGLSWFVVMAIREPKLFHFFVHDELVARVASRQHGRYHWPGFFIPVLLVGLLPWTLLLPSVFRWQAREKKQNGRLSPTWWFLIGWVAVPFLFLSFSGSKLATYVLPLYPAFALALGAWWDQNGRHLNLTRHAAGIVGLFGCMTLALMAVMRFQPDFVPGSPLFMLAGMSAVVMAMAILVVSRKSRSAYVGSGLVAGTLAIWLIVLSQAASLESRFGTGTPMRQFAQRIRNDGTAMPVVFVYKVNVPGLEFYLGRPIHILISPADEASLTTPEQRARVFFSAEQCASLAPPGQPVFGVVRRRALGTEFSTDIWRLVDAAGDFALVQRKETGKPGVLNSSGGTNAILAGRNGATLENVAMGKKAGR